MEGFFGGGLKGLSEGVCQRGLLGGVLGGLLGGVDLGGVVSRGMWGGCGRVFVGGGLFGRIGLGEFVGRLVLDGVYW